MWNSPVVVLCVVAAMAYAALFHLLWGKTFKGLLISWLAALIGLGLGQTIAALLSWRDVLIGEFHLLAASVACWLALAFARRLKI